MSQPTAWRYDAGSKKATYEGHGLSELWLVDTPAEEVFVFRRARNDSKSFEAPLELGRGDTLDSLLLPGFGLGVDELFKTG